VRFPGGGDGVGVEMWEDIMGVEGGGGWVESG